MNSEAKTYHCPNCGGPLTFGIESQAWDCAFCRSKFALEDLEATTAADSTDDYLAGEGADEGLYDEDARAFSCASCGANIVTDATTTATFCVFCKNPTIISARLKDQHKPSYVIPFKKSKQDAINALKRLCKGKPFVPKEFRSEQLVNEMTGVYVPFWLFDAVADAAISGQGDVISTWSDKNYDYVKTDTYHIERAGKIAYSKVPFDGSKKMDDNLMDAVQPYNYSELKPFSMQYLSGHFAEDYDLDAEKLLPKAHLYMENGAVRELEKTAGGYSNLRISNKKTEFSGEKNEYSVLPVWMLTSKHNDKIYTFAMNGQTGKMVGELPFSIGRFFAFLGGLTAAFLILVIAVDIGRWLL